MVTSIKAAVGSNRKMGVLNQVVISISARPRNSDHDFTGNHQGVDITRMIENSN